MKGRAFLFLLAVLLVWAQPATVAAVDPVGVLLVDQGLAKLRRGNQEQVYRASAQRIPLFVGDAVQRGGDSGARLLFRGGDEGGVNIPAPPAEDHPARGVSHDVQQALMPPERAGGGVGLGG